MPRIQYASMNLKPDTRRRIQQANNIIAQYQAMGLTLTLRQLYYRFVAADLIPNNVREYKKLGDIIANARMCGMIDWEAIEDRMREVNELPHWDTPEDILRGCSQQFRVNKWDTQKNYVEVWIEKDALVGVIEGPCTSNDVPYLACRGYASASAVWRAGHGRFRQRLKEGRNCTILYLGDHDPSGIDMTRDVQERIDVFTGRPGAVEVIRLALNMDQIEQYDPPPNPTKETDSRSTGYRDRFGDDCWELDALQPEVIQTLVTEAIEERRNDVLWAEAVAEEQRHRRDLQRVADQWEGVADYVNDRDPTDED